MLKFVWRTPDDKDVFDCHDGDGDHNIVMSYSHQAAGSRDQELHQTVSLSMKEGGSRADTSRSATSHSLSLSITSSSQSQPYSNTSITNHHEGNFIIDGITVTHYLWLGVIDSGGFVFMYFDVRSSRTFIDGVGSTRELWCLLWFGWFFSMGQWPCRR